MCWKYFLKIRKRSISILALWIVPVVVWSADQLDPYFKDILDDAERGVAQAQWRAGGLYHYGVGVSVDLLEALRWYEKATSNGYGDETNEVTIRQLQEQLDNPNRQSPTEKLLVEAPLGLTWGESSNKLISDGIIFEECQTDQSITLCLTNNPPIPLSFGEVYSLTFDGDLGLQKVIVAGKDISDDVSGRKGKEQYENIKEALSEKYSKPTFATERSGITLYDEYDEFYQCLEYSGCGVWTALWELNGSIGLSLNGIRRGEGYLTLTYESPDWSFVLEKRQSMLDANDRNAL